MVIGLLLMTAGVLLLALAPAQFEATVRVSVERVTSTAIHSPGSAGDPNWLAHVLDQIQSKAVLVAAITNLQLDQFWAKQQHRETPLAMEETERELKGRLEVRPGRGTALIEISLRAYEPGEAARLANAVAEAFRVSGAAKVEIVEAASAPGRASRAKNPLPVILFLGGAVLMVVGYVLLRPYLAKVAPAPVLRP